LKPVQDIAASVRQRLLNISKADNRPFNELLQYYAMERFLYRMSLSSHAQDFILKGALLLRVWHSSELRPTMDIDMLGRTGNGEDNIRSQIRDILAVQVEPDGLIFDAESVNTERIIEDADYEGIRVRLYSTLGAARISMRIDIGFGDIVYPRAEMAELPCMLNSPAPSLLCYSRESSIAEKFEAMVKLGQLNSRMKDFYDIWILSRQFRFELSSLAEAVNLTFEQRGTELKKSADAFSADFISSRQTIWAAFRNRLKQERIPASFQDIASELQLFLEPIIKGASSEEKVWQPAGPWS
jgi:hypothetical protein